MKHFVAGREARTDIDALELALGTPLELWLGEEDETPEERAARLDAAADILADDPALLDRTTRLAVETIGATMPELLRLVPAALVPETRRPRRPLGLGVAA
ncbi:hypothetical protein [Streptantibioticus silvisoli]|uniref:Uncharacterized protein n=1 Tax=Streptantibioticus silvisoli TaxID=2705255 RepID=A0ABT6W8R4_9ACTN|nr:hypothetical protein [Streptantibioticus silvisoli]MDI5967147.1 hypothetical protein [Streptantibioticus silvisoli]